MKKEYDLSKLKKRPKKTSVDKDAVKTQISLRIDGSDLSDIRTEAERLGIPYQTFISSILHRYATGDLVDRKSPEIKRLIKTVS